jgi:hypothetical protein
MLLFNYFSGMISCYFLAHTVKMTKLESFQELVYYFGGGRAGILFITLLQIMVYSEMPISFMYNLDVMINKEFKDLNFVIADFWTHLLLTIICLLFLPSVLIRHLNRIKVIMIVKLINLDSWSFHYDIERHDHSASYDILCDRHN